MNDPLNTPERNWSLTDPDYEHRYNCGCGDPTCWCDDRDATNMQIGKVWYCKDCGEQHPLSMSPTMAKIKSDERQDDFNRVRR